MYSVLIHYLPPQKTELPLVEDIPLPTFAPEPIEQLPRSPIQVDQSEIAPDRESPTESSQATGMRPGGEEGFHWDHLSHWGSSQEEFAKGYAEYVQSGEALHFGDHEEGARTFMEAAPTRGSGRALSEVIDPQGVSAAWQEHYAPAERAVSMWEETELERYVRQKRRDDEEEKPRAKGPRVLLSGRQRTFEPLVEMDSSDEELMVFQPAKWAVRKAEGRLNKERVQVYHIRRGHLLGGPPYFVVPVDKYIMNPLCLLKVLPRFEVFDESPPRIALSHNGGGARIVSKAGLGDDKRVSPYGHKTNSPSSLAHKVPGPGEEDSVGDHA